MTISHRMSGSPEYLAYKNAKDRCGNPNHRAWKNYGGRGIRVCDEWLAPGTGFVAFYRHIGARPGDGYELDRIDNDGHYEPGNVRWVTVSENLRNKRGNRLIKIGGRSASVAEWAEESGLSSALLLYRLSAGWPAERLLDRAGSGNKKGPRTGGGVARYDALGESLTMRQWCDRYGVRRDTVEKRLMRGWSLEAALLTPVAPWDAQVSRARASALKASSPSSRSRKKRTAPLALARGPLSARR